MINRNNRNFAAVPNLEIVMGNSVAFITISKPLLQNRGLFLYLPSNISELPQQGSYFVVFYLLPII